jgi:hypothetical protein
LRVVNGFPSSSRTTADGARAAAVKSAEVRAAKAADRRKTLKDLLHDRLEERAEEIVQCFLTLRPGGRPASS